MLRPAPPARCAVERLAVGERELRALDDGVDALARRHRREVEAGQQRELLEHHRALSPRAGLADRVAVVVERDRRLERRLPARHVVAAQQPVLGREEVVDRLRDPAAVEGVAGGVDARLARVSPGARQPPEALGQRAVAEQPARLGDRQVDVGRARPLAAQQLLDAADRRHDPRHHGIAVARVGDRRRSSTSASSQLPKSRSISAQASNAPGTTAASGPVPGDRARARARRRRRAWPPRAPGPGRRARAPCPPRRTRTTAGTSPPGPLRCGSTTCSTKPAAAAASNALPPRSSTDIPAPGRQPVRRGDHPERAAQLGAGREAHARPLLHEVAGDEMAVAPAAPAAPPGSAATTRPTTDSAYGSGSPTAARPGWDVALEHDPPPRALDVWIGHQRRRQQRLRVGCCGRLNRSSRVTGLHHLAEVHHRHPVAQVLHDREVVRDEQAGEAHARSAARRSRSRTARLHGDVEADGSSAISTLAPSARARARRAGAGRRTARCG